MRASQISGMALITVLIMLSMMSALTLLLLMNLMEDIRSSAVLEVNTRLFYAADAGLEEARTRLLYGATSQISSLPATPTADWAGYIRKDSSINVLGLDPAYSGYGSTSLETALGTPPFELVKIFYNTEANKNRDIDGDSSLDTTTVVYLGDDGAGGLARNLTGTGSPIRTIQSYATVDGRRALLESEIVSVFVTIPDIDAVIRSNGDGTFNGTSSTSVNRTDNGTTLPAIMTAGTSPTGTFSGTVFPPTTPDEVETGASTFDVDSYVAAAEGVFTPITDLVSATTTSDSQYLWSSFSAGTDAAPKLMYSDRSIKFNGGTAYGILVVDGDVDISSHDFHGLIIASGEALLAGGGSAAYNLSGAVIAGGDVDFSGSFAAELDLDAINNYLQSIRTKVITFREVRK